MYDIVLLDADGTLFDFDLAEATSLRGAFSAIGIPCDEETVSLYHGINIECWKQFERGEIDGGALTRVRFARLFDRLGIDVDPAVFNDDYVDRLAHSGYLFSGAEDFCRRLKNAGCRLYLVTNGRSRSQRGRLAASPLNPLLDDVFISEEIGFHKPQKEYFDYVFAHIPTFDPARTVILGDSPTSDIAGGYAAGIKTIFYSPEKAEVTPEADFTAADYDEAADIIMKGEK